MKISSLDHLVLTISDIENTCRFYQTVLGMDVITFGEGRKALKFGNQKFKLHQVGKEFEPKANRPTPGAIDLCLLTNTALDIVIEELNSHNITIEEGPILRTGATHKLNSVYIRDPDQNLIEIANTL